MGDCSNDPVVVLVAGKIGSGKSTALNNIYGLKFEARSSPSSVTEVVHKETVQKNGSSIDVIDSPGLGGIKRSTKSVVGEMVSAVKGSDFVLLYCLPVKPSDTLTETDQSTIVTLNSHFGTRVWDKCVVLLTFSDIARRSFGDDNVGYISYLRGHIQAFYGILKKCGSNLSTIKLIYDVGGQEMDSLQEHCSGEIVAVPMMNMKNNAGVDISPGRSLSCTELAFNEIVRMSQLARMEEDGCCKAYRRWYKSAYQFVSDFRPRLSGAVEPVRCGVKNPSTAVAVRSGVCCHCQVAFGAALGGSVGFVCGVCSFIWFILLYFLGAIISAVRSKAKKEK